MRARLFFFQAEEAPAALLLAHAAQLSVIKGARRRAALWFLFAANRLEKCGIVSVPHQRLLLPFCSYVPPETFDDVFLEKGAYDVRIASREGVLPVFLGKRG